MFSNILAGRRRAQLALLGALLAVAAVSVAATAPSARQAVRHVALACGDVVTTDVTLGSDLNCPSSFGLIVGANDIKIDLNGHTISGNGTDDGILNNGHAGVTIKNGTIDHFTEGIRLDPGSNNNTVKKVRVSNNTADGILITVSSSSDQLTDNDVFSNGQNGISLAGGSGAQLTGNQVEGNNAEGIVIAGSSGFVVSGNTVLNNGTEGIFEGASSSGQISKNVVNGNTFDGIRALDSRVTLTGNRASFNSLLGINAAPGSTDGGKNVVQDNAGAKQCANVACTEVSS
jgi:parallel beta-helix repeat protein